MERTADTIEQPVAVELMPSQDRASVVLLLRSDQPIKLAVLIPTLENFIGMLKAQHEKQQSKIDVQRPKIIVP